MGRYCFLEIKYNSLENNPLRIGVNICGKTRPSASLPPKILQSATTHLTFRCSSAGAFPASDASASRSDYTMPQQLSVLSFGLIVSFLGKRTRSQIGIPMRLNQWV